MTLMAKGNAWLYCLAAAWLLSVAMFATSAQAQSDPLTTPALSLKSPAGTIEQQVAASLARVAPEAPMEDWPIGLRFTQQPRTLPGYEYPLDLTAQWRISPDYCPDYHPDQTPGQTGADCYAELIENWQLQQNNQVSRNPFAVARDELQRLHDDPHTRRRKLLWAAGYLWVHRNDEQRVEGAIDLLISDLTYGRRDVLLSALGEPVLKRLPENLKQITSAPGEASIDMRVTTQFAHDSVATNAQVLQIAGERGLNAVVIASRSDLGDALQAQRWAEKLKREGKLPESFKVVIGQYISSRTGDVVGLYLKDRVLDGQTMSATIKDIHRQGGLAYLARPGDIGAAASLARLPFDGYLIQAGNFELFRTLLLLDDPRFVQKPALYASNSTVAFTTGLPFSNVRLELDAEDPLRAGLAAHQGYAAGALYLPWMMALLTKPIAYYQKTLNRFFQFNDEIAIRLGRLVHADNMIIRTSWDDEMRNLISLSDSFGTIGDLLHGRSKLQKYPHMTYIEAEYGWFSVGFDRTQHRWLLSSRWRW